MVRVMASVETSAVQRVVAHATVHAEACVEACMAVCAAVRVVVHPAVQPVAAGRVLKAGSAARQTVRRVATGLRVVTTVERGRAHRRALWS